ncbi:acetoin utilization protein AcuC [Rhodococcus sp. X156]|uniref:acetoin utilization protein AcuC n=1 Tax=Rhodococcus sp. X156 TaxID=2499145 RepID=UPI000FDB1A26|nr:acetoin utilization protein AcuC [Rhodococcus sp. X156]
MSQAPAAVVWTSDYLSYKLSEDHPLDPIRLDLTMRLSRGLGLLDGVETIRPQAATDDDLLRIHTPAYLAAVKGAPTQLQAVNHGLGTEDNPIFEHMHESSALLTGGSLAAAREIAAGRTRRAVSLGGGLHHAMADAASGFCVYNDPAIAISWLLDHGYDRIAYVDVDVHHGDGVQAAFVHDPRVLTLSLHQHPATLWPGTGWPQEVGRGEAAGSTVNLPLMPGTDDQSWLRAFHAVVPGVLRAFRPQVLVTQCGVDTHREDPLADLRLSVDGHRAIFQALRALAEETAEGRWLAMGGGGYGLLRVVPRSWTHLLAAVLDRDVAVERQVPADWTAHVATLSPQVPVPTTMGDGTDVTHQPWDGVAASGDPATTKVDTMIRDTRRAVFPLLGLDPEDPRD